MTAYFGAVDASGNPSGTSSNNDVNVVFWRAYTCPGTGQKQVTALEAMMNYGTAVSPLRMAIYDAAGTTLLAQGTAAWNPANATDTWEGHVGAGNLSVNPLILDGGTDYIIALTFGSGLSGSACTHVDGTRSAANHAAYDYTGGFPASLPAVQNTFSHYAVRVTVEDSESPPSLLLPILQGARW